MNAIQFQFQFDVQQIRQELEAIAESYNSINSFRIKENHLMGVDLIIPTPDGEKNDQGYTYRSTPELDQSPYLQSILNSFPCDKHIYRVHNLRAKGKIALHRDSDRGLANRIVRIHIPVTTNEEIYFYVNGERIGMQNGECWFADITQLHEVENRSDTDRLQLMIDCDLNDWWKSTLKASGLPLEDFSEWNKHSLEVLQSMKENFSIIGGNPDPAIIEKIDRAIAKKSIR